MGGGGYTPTDWQAFKQRTNVQNKSVNQIFTRTYMMPELNPLKIRREARDSIALPRSTPIIIGNDITGSMSSLQDALIHESELLVREIYSRKPVSDPQLAFMAVGDAHCDYAPLQVTQFESDSRIAEQLSNIYYEQGGGGNCEESYHLPWYFALKHVDFDAWDKRGKKGYIFTIGNDGCPSVLHASHVKEFIGDTLEADIPIDKLLEMVNRRWEVFHIHLKDGYYTEDVAIESWRKVLGERLIILDDVTQITKVIVSTLEVLAGKDVDDVADSWGDQKAALAIKGSLQHIQTTKDTDGFVEF